MSVRRSELGQDTQIAVKSHVAEIVSAGLLGGLVGGVSIWIYEAIVWVGVTRLMPLAGIPRNATGLVFGKEVQDSLGPFAYILGKGIHFFFCFAWAALFAYLGPICGSGVMRRRSWPCSMP